MTRDEKIKGTFLEALSPREETVIRLYYGLNSSERTYTLKEIGEHFYITKERVRQIREKAIRRIAKECKFKSSTVQNWFNKQREQHPVPIK